MERFLIKVQEWIEDYIDWFAERLMAMIDWRWLVA